MAIEMAQFYRADITLLHVLPPNPLDAHRTEAQEDLNAFAWPHFAGISTCQALAEGEVDGLVQVFGSTFARSHDEGKCKGHRGILLTLKVNYFYLTCIG